MNEFEIIHFANGITLNGKLISETSSKALKAREEQIYKDTKKGDVNKCN